MPKKKPAKPAAKTASVKKSAVKKSAVAEKKTPAKKTPAASAVGSKKPPARTAQSLATSATKKTPAASAVGSKKKKTDAERRATLKPPSRMAAEDQAYAKHRARAAARARISSSSSRELGSLPPVADPARRAECQEDLKLALETYFADVFRLGWSSQHIEVIDSLTQALRHGGLFALGMPRGSGKTSLVVHSALLAMLVGWRRHLVLIGASADAAYEMLDIVKVQLETNELLLADFPEVCFPVWSLEGIVQRSKGQTIDGEPTQMQWSGRKKIVLPSTYRKGVPSGGGVIQAVGLLGRIRGMLHVTPDGESLRPDVFLGDDLQTDQSAKNVAQVERREALLNGAVMGLSGPGKRIAGLSTLTIVRQGDLADRLLDRKTNPHWNGRTFSLVEQFPRNTQLWERYAELREIDLAMGKGLLPGATRLYRDHKLLMDDGAVVPWVHRREPHELSALQNAMNLKLANPASFDAEYQNKPQLSNTAIGSVPYPTSDVIIQRVNGYARHDVPEAATRIYTAVDVQQDVLFYLQLALAEDFTGWVIDYGPWPSQPLGSYWTLGELQVSLRQHTGIADIAGAWYAGLNQLLEHLYSRQYTRDDGAQMSIDQTIIDANYGDSSATVYSVCRQSPHRPLPFHGKGITAKQQPIVARPKKRGERAGAEWFMPATRGTKVPRHVISDTNLIKTLLARRLTVPVGSGGDWTLFQAPISAHRMIADQLSAEYPVSTSGRGRELLEWSLLPGRDNHYLDCAVMAATLGLMDGCAANLQQVNRPGHAPPPVQRKSLAQLRAEAQKSRRAA